MSLDAGRRVVSRFETARVQSYFPLHRSVEVRRGRRVARFSPLWPGYVLARVGLLVDRVRKIRGVGDIVRRGDCYCRLRDLDVTALREQEGHDGFFESPPVGPRFVAGQSVRVQGAGPFAGQLAQYVELDEEQRHHAFVSLFGRFSEAEFDDEELAAA
jgi:transcription antitermination factor NusG